MEILLGNFEKELCDFYLFHNIVVLVFPLNTSFKLPYEICGYTLVSKCGGKKRGVQFIVLKLKEQCIRQVELKPLRAP